jgi:hypothetical protein
VRKQSRIGSTAGVLAIAVAVGAPATSVAAVDSKVTLQVKSAKRFDGDVKAAVDECVVGRKVVLKRVGPSGNDTVGKTFATESGHYVIKRESALPAGAVVFAKIKSYEAPGGALCRGDRSPQRIV